MTSGKARSRDGEIREVSYAAGDTKHHVYAPGEFMTHDLENIGDTPLIFATVEFLHSAKRTFGSGGVGIRACGIVSAGRSPPRITGN
jgi:beta-alanine degradation protein BauB